MKTIPLMVGYLVLAIIAGIAMIYMARSIISDKK